HTSDQERDQHRWPGGLVGHRACQREDPGADDATDTDRGQLPQAERAAQPSALDLLDVLERFASEDVRPYLRDHRHGLSSRSVNQVVLTKERRKNARFAGRSASRRMKYGYHCDPNGT